MRTRSALLAAAACAALGLPVQAQLRGDLNEDGRVTATDALLVSRYAAGAISLQTWQLDRANFVPVSGGKPVAGVKAADAHYIARIAAGAVGPERPTIDTVTGTNPVTVSGTCSTASATVTIFVSNTASPAKTVPSVTGVACSGGTYSAQAFLLFDGTNRLHAVSLDENGIPSLASNVMAASYTNNNSHTITANITSGTLVWTAGDSAGVPTPYTINPSGTTVSIASGATVVLGPGAVVEIAGGKIFQVAGTLAVRGAAGSEVSLRKGTGTGNWQRLEVTNAGTATIEHARIEGATIGIQSSGVLTLQQSVVIAPSGGGDGVKLIGSAARGTLEWNELIGAAKNDRGVWLSSAGTLGTTATSKSRLTGNVIHDFDRCVDASNGAKHVLEKNHLHTCNTGIFAGTNAPLVVESANRIENHSTWGIAVESATSATACPFQPRCWNYDFLLVIRGNVFRNNAVHVKTLNPGQGGVRSQYVALHADRNDWGSADPAVIGQKIQDELDSGAKVDLLVGFTPFLVPDTATLVHDYVIGNLSDQSFAAGTPATRTVLGPLVAREKVTTTIPAGLTFPMPAGSVVGVLGNLVVSGTPAAPVTFRGTSAAPGHWTGISVIDTPDAEATDFDQLVVEDATIAVDVEANRSPAIENATFDGFSQIGIRFQGASSAAVSSVAITGTRREAGIQMTDASPAITGSSIQNLLTGLHLKGNSNPTLIGNTITGNVWGLWLEGEGFAGTDAPNPIVTGNTISGNAGFPPTNANDESYCWTSGANLCMSGYTNPANVNATGNYWGTTDGNAIRASIVNVSTRRILDAAGTNQDVHGGNVDFSGFFLDAAGGPAVDGFTWSSSGYTRFRQDKVVLKPVTAPGDIVTIRFTPAQTLVSLSMKVYSENDTALARLIDTPCTRSSAPKDVEVVCTWDGRDSPNNEIVPWEAYRFVVTGTPTDGGPAVTLDPPRRENYLPGGNNQVFGDTASGCFTANPFPTCVSDTTNTFDVTVDLAKNQYFNFDYTVIQHYARPDEYAVRAKVQVYEDLSFGNVIATPLNFPILPSFNGQTPNAVRAMWDGRDDEGKLITGEHAIRFWVPEPLHPFSVIVENATSRILSVSADPYLIYHSYDQTTTLGLQLGSSAKVKVYILPPGELDIAAAVQTISLNDGNALSAGTHTFGWNGQPAGEDTNRRSAVADGVYSFAVEAQHPTNPAHASLFRGVIQVRL